MLCSTTQKENSYYNVNNNNSRQTKTPDLVIMKAARFAVYMARNMRAKEAQM